MHTDKAEQWTGGASVLASRCVSKKNSNPAFHPFCEPVDDVGKDGLFSDNITPLFQKRLARTLAPPAKFIMESVLPSVKVLFTGTNFYRVNAMSRSVLAHRAASRAVITRRPFEAATCDNDALFPGT